MKSMEQVSTTGNLEKKEVVKSPQEKHRDWGIEARGVLEAAGLVAVVQLGSMIVLDTLGIHANAGVLAGSGFTAWMFYLEKRTKELYDKKYGKQK